MAIKPSMPNASARNKMNVPNLPVQQAGGLECKPVLGELTYGLERLAMYLQGVDNVYELLWTTTPAGPVYYGDVSRWAMRQ